MKGSVLIEFHPYRGFGRMVGPLISVVTLGWVSVSVLPYLLTERLWGRVNALRTALGTKKFPQEMPRETMAVWREERPIHRRVN